MSQFSKVDQTRLDRLQKEIGSNGRKAPAIRWLTGQNPSDEVLGLAIDSIDSARTWMSKALTRIAQEGNDDVMFFAALMYFGIGDGINPIPKDEKKTIVEVLSKTMKGLNSSFAIKLGREDKGTAGYVTVHPDADKMKRKNAEPKKIGDYHTRVIQMGPKKGLLNKTEAAYGAIHISHSRMSDREMAPKTIIHEATHKYAGTRDYFLWRDDGKDVDFHYDDFLLKYDKSPLAKRSEAIWKTYSMKNADSWAWFVKALGT